MTKNFINSATHAAKRVPLGYGELGTSSKTSTDADESTQSLPRAGPVGPAEGELEASSLAPTGAGEQNPNSPRAAPAGHWLLICPPDNWKEPLPVTLAELRLLEHLSLRLGLVTSLQIGLLVFKTSISSQFFSLQGSYVAAYEAGEWCTCRYYVPGSGVNKIVTNSRFGMVRIA